MEEKKTKEQLITELATIRLSVAKTFYDFQGKVSELEMIMQRHSQSWEKYFNDKKN